MYDSNVFKQFEIYALHNKLKRLGKSFACDTETALIPHAFNGRGSLRLIQFWSPKYAFCADTFNLTPREWNTLTEFFSDPNLVIVFHNAKFDLRVFEACDIKIAGKIHDSMLQSYVINNGIPSKSLDPINKIAQPHSLFSVVRRELGILMDKTLQAQDWMKAVLTEQDIEYGMKDVEYTYKVCRKMMKRIKSEDLSTAYEIECRAIKATIQMEQTGMRMDRYATDNYVLELRESGESYKAAYIEELHGALMDVGHDGLPLHESGEFNLNKATKGSEKLGTKIYAGYNPGSSQQTLKYLKIIGIEPINEKTGKPSLDQKILEEFRKEFSIIDTYLRWKKTDKLQQMCKSFIKYQVEDTWRVHPQFKQTGTVTGRYSSQKPNLQQVPRGDMRYLFKVKKGRQLISLDLKSAELYTAASPRIANEDQMMNAFKAGADIHRRTASLMFKKKEVEVTPEERQSAKATNFGALFGSSPGGLVNYFSGMGLTITYAEGEKFLKAWFEAYPKIAAWHKQCRNRVERGEAVRMVDGRRRFLHGEDAKYTVFCNNVVQGTCASIVKLAMAVIYDRLPVIDETARIVAMIHDELLIECVHEKAEKVLEMAKSVMEEAGKEILGDEIALIAEGSYSDSWGGAK